jgi:hypothetical protein
MGADDAMDATYGALDSSIDVDRDARRTEGRDGRKAATRGGNVPVRVGAAVVVAVMGAIAFTSRERARDQPSAVSLGGSFARSIRGEFDLPDRLDEYIDAMEFGPEVYAALGTPGPGEDVPGASPRKNADGTEDGMFISTKGGRNATLLRIKMLKERLRGRDDENLANEERANFVWQATVDEGATQPAPVNASAYMQKLHEEIEQDKALLEVHEAMLAARLGGRWDSFSDGVSAASNANGAVVANTVNVEFCWKDSYGRGVGKVPSHCPSNKETIAGGVLCYTKCHHLGNYARFGYDCHQRCGSGWNDHGLLCHRGNHGRGVGIIQCGWDYWASSSSTLGEHTPNGRRLLGNAKTRLVCGGKFCSGGRQDCLGLCYHPCPGSHPNWIGCNLCGVSCTGNGYAHGIAPSCPKKIHCSHGLEAATCPPGWDYDAGLCYQKCRSGFTGVGPVCWGDAPTVSGKKWVHCGMGAARDDAACGSAITNQILGPLEIIAFVATAGSSGAAATGAKAAARAGTKVAQAGGKLAALKKAAKSLDKGMEVVGKTTGYVSAMNNVNSAESVTDGVRAAAELASVFDPTGVSSTVAAYAFDTCDKIHGKAV